MESPYIDVLRMLDQLVVERPLLSGMEDSTTMTQSIAETIAGLSRQVVCRVYLPGSASGISGGMCSNDGTVVSKTEHAIAANNLGSLGMYILYLVCHWSGNITSMPTFRPELCRYLVGWKTSFPVSTQIC